MAKITIEVCCGSADDVFAAAAAGADRVELNSAMFLGGLTPSMGELKVAQGAGLPVMAMVRPRQGGFCYTGHEFETMLHDARLLCENGADGIVFGILNADGTIDEARCAELLAPVKAAGKQAVFHRAIDVVPDWRAGLDTLVRLGFDRVLTSGQQPSVRDGAATVAAMHSYAAGRIEILPGAGITLANAAAVVAETGCGQIHVLLDKMCTDTSTAANRSIYYGGALYPPEDTFSMADTAQLSALAGLVNPK